MGGDLQGTRSSATHGAAPMAGKRDQSQLTSRPEFLALLSSGPTRAETVEIGVGDRIIPRLVVWSTLARMAVRAGRSAREPAATSSGC